MAAFLCGVTVRRDVVLLYISNVQNRPILRLFGIIPEDELTVNVSSTVNVISGELRSVSNSRRFVTALAVLARRIDEVSGSKPFRLSFVTALVKLACRINDVSGSNSCRFDTALVKLACLIKEVSGSNSVRFNAALAKLACRNKEVSGSNSLRLDTTLAKLASRIEEVSGSNSRRFDTALICRLNLFVSGAAPTGDGMAISYIYRKTDFNEFV